MGLAASQARFLQLTARKSNLEFQGQQINQQRLTLANESSGLYTRQLALVVPTPPSSTSDAYTTSAYSFTCKTSGLDKNIKFTYDSSGKMTGATVFYSAYNSEGVSVTKEFNVITTGPATGSGANVSHGVPTDLTTDIKFDVSSGRLSQLTLSVWDESIGAAVTTTYTGSDLVYSPIYNDKKYKDDLNKYEYQKALYDAQVSDINSQTAAIQQQDRSLELKMKQLDTEHTGIQTEMDAVQKVIQKNIEGSYKTFS